MVCQGHRSGSSFYLGKGALIGSSLNFLQGFRFGAYQGLGRILKPQREAGNMAIGITVLSALP